MEFLCVCVCLLPLILSRRTVSVPTRQYKKIQCDAGTILNKVIFVKIFCSKVMA